MRLLAIDTALEACSVAVFDTASEQMLARESAGMVRGHAEALMPMVARVMHDSGLAFADLNRVAVTVGPGSFTGLRVGIAAARGLALAADRPIVGLTTLAAYAAPLLADDDAIPVTVAIDARHAHVYLQTFTAAGQPVAEPRVAPVHDAIDEAIANGARIIGTGANLLAAAWPSDAPPPAQVLQRPAPEINWVARLGAAATENTAPPRPLYLRAPDARPQDAARLPRRP